MVACFTVTSDDHLYHPLLLGIAPRDAADVEGELDLLSRDDFVAVGLSRGGRSVQIRHGVNSQLVDVITSEWRDEANRGPWPLHDRRIGLELDVTEQGGRLTVFAANGARHVVVARTGTNPGGGTAAAAQFPFESEHFIFGAVVGWESSVRVDAAGYNISDLPARGFYASDPAYLAWRMKDGEQREI
jgi:hypothetical protein